VDSIDQALKTFSKAICLPAKGKQDNAKTIENGHLIFVS
jgi:hypothetical protein